MTSLDEYERELRERLGRSGSPPFLGHYEIAEYAGRELRRRLTDGSGSLVVGFRRLLLEWPALATAWIARHVRERYGEDDDQQFWPILAALFERDIPVRDRDLLARLFAYGCRRLELAIPQNGRNVDRFVVQAGAPVHQLDVLVRRFLETERARGLPDEDDDIACFRFASEAAERSRPTNPRLARILEADRTAWYVRQWVSLRGGGFDDADPTFREALLSLLEQVPERTAPVPLPQLVCAGGELGIRVPPFPRGRLMLEGSRRQVAFDPLATSELVSLAELGPGTVSWTFRDKENLRRGRIEPPAPDGDEVVFFDAVSGRFAARGRFAVPPLRLGLASGRYVVVAAGRFVGSTGPAERSLDFWIADLGVDGQEQTLQRGTAGIRIEPLGRTHIELPDPAFVAVSGEAVFSGPHLEPAVVHPGSTREQRYELSVDGDGRELGRVGIVLENGRGEADLAPALGALGPRLARCRIALVRAGERRALARTSLLLWNGLQRVEDGRFVGPVPTNLDRASSREIVVGPEGITLRRDRPYAMALLVFDKLGDRGAKLSLGVPPVDPVALLETRDERGQRVEHIVDPKQPIVVRPGDARMLEIRCPNAAAALRIGRNRFERPFRGRPVYRLPLVAAAEGCAGADSTIEVTLPSGSSWLLAKLTVPSEVLGWSAEGSVGTATALAFRLREPVSALRLRADELLRGHGAEIELVPDDLSRREGRTGLTGRLAVDPGRMPYAFRLQLVRETLPAGLWLLRFECRDEASTWRAPTNARGDAFAWLLENELGALEGSDLSTSVGIEQLAALFARTHRALRRCYAPEAWFQAHVRRLETWWRRASGALGAEAQADRLVACLLPLAFEDPPSDAAPSWVPILGFWQAFPRFLALAGGLYRELAEARASSARTIAAMAEVARAGGLARWAAGGAPFAPGFLSCFANLSEASAGGGAVELRGFDFARYRDSIARCAAGEDALEHRGLAGGLELVEAARAFARKWVTVSSSSGYLTHKPLAMSVVRLAARWLQSSGTRRARTHIGDIRGDLAVRVVIDEGDSSALVEELQPAASAVALATRLEPRSPGTLDDFLTTLAQGCGDRQRVLDGLEFLWNLGRDSFAFWLLFWEMLLTTGDRHA